MGTKLQPAKTIHLNKFQSQIHNQHMNKEITQNAGTGAICTRQLAWHTGFKSNAKLKTAGALLLLLFIAVLPSRAALLAYEGFGYSAGANLAGLNGGAGWNGGWVDVRDVGGITINAGNLIVGA